MFLSERRKRHSKMNRSRGLSSYAGEEAEKVMEELAPSWPPRRGGQRRSKLLLYPFQKAGPIDLKLPPTRHPAVPEDRSKTTTPPSRLAREGTIETGIGGVGARGPHLQDRPRDRWEGVQGGGPRGPPLRTNQ